MTKIYIIFISAALYTTLIFFAGWHYEVLRLTAKQLEQTDKQIANANKKIVENKSCYCYRKFQTRDFR